MDGDAGTVEGQEQAEGAAESAEQNGQSAEPDYTPIYERLDQMKADLGSELEERMAQFQPAPQEEPDPVRDDLQRVLEAGDDVSPEQAQAVIDQMVERKAQGMVEPLMQELQSLRGYLDGKELEEKYPEFKDSGKAQAAAQKAAELAYERTGDEQLAGYLGNQGWFIELAHLADAARQRAADEGSAGEQEVELESAGAAAPGQGEDPDDLLRKAIRESDGGERSRNSFLFG